MKKVFLLLLLVPALGWAQARPSKILSLSQSADDCLAIFVTPDRILRPVPLGQDIVASGADLVFLDWNTSPDIAGLLKEAKIKNEILKKPGSWEDIRAITLKVAQLTRSNPVPVLAELHRSIQGLRDKAQLWKGDRIVQVQLPTGFEDQSLITELLDMTGLKASFDGKPGEMILSSPESKLNRPLKLNVPGFLLTSRGPSVLKELEKLQGQIFPQIQF